MNCPYCNTKMQKGYLQSSHPFFWGVRKRKISFTASEEGDIKVSVGFWNGCTAESWYCAGCNKLITEVVRKKLTK